MCTLYSKPHEISFPHNEWTEKTFFCLILYFRFYGDLEMLLRMGRGREMRVWLEGGSMDTFKMNVF